MCLTYKNQLSPSKFFLIPLQINQTRSWSNNSSYYLNHENRTISLLLLVRSNANKQGHWWTNPIRATTRQVIHKTIQLPATNSIYPFLFDIAIYFSLARILQTNNAGCPYITLLAICFFASIDAFSITRLVLLPLNRRKWNIEIWVQGRNKMRLS